MLASLPLRWSTQTVQFQQRLLLLLTTLELKHRPVLVLAAAKSKLPAVGLTKLSFMILNQPDRR